MCRLHKWYLAISDVASTFLNTPVDEAKELTFVEAPRVIRYPEPTVWRLKHQLYSLTDSPRSWQMRLTQVLQSISDPSGNVNLIVTANVDDLVISGESSSVLKFFQEL